MKQIACYMCRNSTDKPTMVLTYGWNKELTIPAQVHLCPRCHEVWKPETHLHYIDVSHMSKKDANEVCDTMFKRYFKKLKVANG